jgi:hypothetical protein
MFNDSAITQQHDSLTITLIAMPEIAMTKKSAKRGRYALNQSPSQQSISQDNSRKSSSVICFALKIPSVGSIQTRQ